MSHQLHAPATLPLVKVPLVPTRKQAGLHDMEQKVFEPSRTTKWKISFASISKE
jgi:hypothetical protein